MNEASFDFVVKMNITPSLARALFCLSLAGLTTTVLFLFLRKDEEDEQEEEEKNEGTRTSRTTVIEVKIPSESVGIVIGRGGANIKEIQDLSSTKINFKDGSENEPYRVCVIRGTPEAAQLAESFIHEFLSNQPEHESCDIFVPDRACGRIIGRKGESIRSICNSSHAKVTVTNTTRRGACIERRITITGTAEEIEMAKSLVQEKVFEDEQMRKKAEIKHTSQSSGKGDCQNFPTPEEEIHTTIPDTLPPQLLAETCSVFVSALCSPDEFWLQVNEPRTLELVPLTDQMTEYYNKDENKEIHKVKEVKVGQYVAVPFSFDDKWHRAVVERIVEDENDAQESKVCVFYIDYGDSDDLKMKDVFELKRDFLQLRFQAIECSLAKVLPKGGKWSDKAVDLFEELTHAAKWVALTAKIISYKEREDGLGKKKSVPCIDLFDPQVSENISIAEQLVKAGYAEWEVNNGKTLVAKIGTAVCSEVQEGNVSKIGGGDARQPTSVAHCKPVMYGVDDRDESDFSDEMEMC